METGKTPSQKRVNPRDFLEITIPNIPIEKQNSIGKKILELEESIDRDLLKIQNEQAIIDEVFFESFGVDHKFENEIELPDCYSLSLRDLSTSIDLRNSYKYYATKYQILKKRLSKCKLKYIREFTQIPIRLGKSVSPEEDYDTSNTGLDSELFYYISMASIKNWIFEKDSSNRVNERYFEENKEKSSVMKGDIIIARSGEGTIGKVAYIPENINAIFCDFTMRVRILPEYDFRFFYYYFRTSIFQLLVEQHKKGLGNNTNIFPSQINLLPVFDITKDEQREIADHLDKKLIKMNKLRADIREKRFTIEELINQIL